MSRKPQSFSVGDTALDMSPVSDAPVDDIPLPEPLPYVPSGFSIWTRIFWGGLATLITFGIGLYVTNLVLSAFARNDWLGWGLFYVALITALAFVVMIAREVLALRRLQRFDTLRRDAERAVLENSHAEADAIAGRLRAVMAGNRRVSPGLARYDRTIADHIVDGRDKLQMIERETLEPLDGEARRMIAAAARRVSLVTALSPRAVLDLAVVFYSALTMIRRMADLYGGRPGLIGQGRLMGRILAHLAVTGGMAAGDEVLHQILGQGLAARLSARLGEGMLNGLLTARLGLATLQLIRPLPFIGSPQPTLKDVSGDLIRGTG